MSDFECITMNDNADVIYDAEIHTMPLIADNNMHRIATFHQLTQFSLTFLRGTDKKATNDEYGVIVSISPEEWRPCNDSKTLAILDPGGLTGRILLYVQSKTQDLLVSVDDVTKTISTTAKGK